MNKITPNYPIKVLNKAFTVLDILLKNNAPMSMTEISEQLHFYPSTIHRILDTLKYGGYVEQDPSTQKYQLGLKLLELGMAKLQQIDLIRESTPYLKELAKRCDETVHLGILEDTNVLYLVKEESTQTIRMISYVGKRAPLHCTALGKILLAFLPSDKREHILDKIELSKLTENTITDKCKLIEELNKIEQEGFALDREENEKYVRCIAAPIRNYQGRVIAAVSISGPSYRINKGKQSKLIDELIYSCNKISARLGFQLSS
ncbi:MAG: IclR family transcriptional regulator [Atribacterota bacterium]|nr:IclR family transcriptional regulator [Atribacterota bacterium]MDD4895992.1 IclR family transcriptional regulator [Atribacterota bacterium]MDD5637765.1 IclR family transcriptional regulator [Atribacterota bacterium]